MPISKLFNISRADENIPYMPRQINLSGNIVNFAMPENFSKDFPADPLVEKLDLDNPELFKNGKPVEILRRWWDFKTDSFFSRDAGTMMMTIHVYRIPDKEKPISDFVSFLDSVLEDMEKRSQENNKNRDKEDVIYFPAYYQSFSLDNYQGARWLSSGSGTANEDEKVFYYFMPLNRKTWLEVSFYFAPDNSLNVREFIDGYARGVLDKIMDTFRIEYAKDNTIKDMRFNENLLQ